MAQPDPNRPDPSSYTGPAWAPALSALVLMVAIGAMSTWMVLRYDLARPGVGEMIVFVPSTPDADVWRLPVEASAISGHGSSRDGISGRGLSREGCVFDSTVMAMHGGSLIIEAREETSPPRFHLHWAGGRTAAGKDDCGESADIVLDRLNLQRLANAAGGFGVKPFRTVRASPVSP